MNAALKHYSVAEMEAKNPDFIAFMREMYAKRGWLMPRKIHVDLREVAKKMNKSADAIRAADEFFEKTGTVAEKPKEIKIHG